MKHFRFFNLSDKSHKVFEFFSGLYRRDSNSLPYRRDHDSSPNKKCFTCDDRRAELIDSFDDATLQRRTIDDVALAAVGSFFNGV